MTILPYGAPKAMHRDSTAPTRTDLTVNAEAPPGTARSAADNAPPLLSVTMPPRGILSAVSGSVAAEV